MKPTLLLLTCLIEVAFPMGGLAQPTITIQPRSQTNALGSTLILSVEAASVSPLSYQWNKGSSTVAGATNAALVFTNLQSSQAGNYTVVITNVEGAVTSAVAFVRVLLPPAITTQPTNFPPLSLGASVGNRVAASGTAPLYYQWRLNETYLPDETSTSLVLTNLQLTNAGGYTVVVTNAAGSVTSQVATLTVDPTFTKITAGPIVTDRLYSWAAAWGDYDDDGFLDLYVANGGLFGGNQNNSFYHNNRNGSFTKLTTGRPVTDFFGSSSVAWGDWNNDGDLDLFVGHAFDQISVLYENLGGTTFAAVPGPRIQPAPDDTGGSSWVDFDNDGDLDLYVPRGGTSNHINLLYRNNGDGTFTLVTPNPITQSPDYTLAAAWSDYDNDGDLDLFTAQFRGHGNWLYVNNGNGNFTKVATGSAVNESADSLGVAWGDYDNDGNPDLFVANGDPFGNSLGANQKSFLYRNKGNGTFAKITDGSVANDTGVSTSAAWGDYDNDGYLDLFIADGRGNNRLYRNTGDGAFQKLAEGSLIHDGGHSHACAWADYDNDGFLDLFVANLENEPNFLYRNNGNQNAWLKVKCIGTVSNRSAIGAKLRVRAQVGGEELWQLRELTGGDGCSGQTLIAHFGLGDAAIIDTLRIEWPSGIVQEFHDVAPKQFLTLTEPARLQMLGAGAFRVQSWKGMAFEVQVSTDIDQWSPLTIVTNLTGTLEFTDPNAANHLRRFYRTVLR